MWYKTSESVELGAILGEVQEDGSRSPGIYRMADEEYRAMPGLNWSTIRNSLVSPEYAKHKRDFPAKATPAMEMGTMMHMSVLQPAQFNSEYFVAPPIVKSDVEFVKGDGGWQAIVDGESSGELYKTKKEAQECVPAYWVGEGGFNKLSDAKAYVAGLGDGKRVISEEDFNLANKVCKHLHMGDDVAASWLADVVTEVVLVWYERVMLPSGETVDVLCKAKIDAWDRRRGMVWDLKTTRDSDPDRFIRTMLKYQYHGQLAWYANAVKRVLEGAAPECFDMMPLVAGIMAVELSMPFQTTCMVLDGEFLELGEKCFRKALQLWVEGENSGYWPKRCVSEVILSVPGWAKESDYEL